MRTSAPRSVAEAPAQPEPTSPPTVAPAPAPAPRAPEDDGRPVKFTAVLDQQTVETFETVTTDMRRVGRLAGGRYPSRADVLRAVVALVDNDAALAERVAQRITADLTRRAAR